MVGRRGKGEWIGLMMGWMRYCVLGDRLERCVRKWVRRCVREIYSGDVLGKCVREMC